ncbi:MAG: response regulator [Microcoleus sp. CAN_BIN18]|nr:response regulator [Microcoleus sp. CAN_BIN18]
MPKILVIEDNNLIRETVLELLESRGFEAVGAENGQVGIELAIAQIPDLILSDVMMPELNGFEVFAILRSYPATASIPFIFMTASEMEKAIELKADGYLKKPCSATEMFRAIATQLENRKLATQNIKNYRTILRHKIPASAPGIKNLGWRLRRFARNDAHSNVIHT